MTNRIAGAPRPPGVHLEAAAFESARIEVADAGVAGFVGFARKGPLGRPCRVTGWDDFARRFGPEPVGHLADGVAAFFANGGVACHVVRVARGARAAERVLVDGWGRPRLRVAARSPGRWGDAIRVSIGHEVVAGADLAADLEIGDDRARLSSTRGFAVGALVRIACRGRSDHVIATEVDERSIGWATETPLNHAYAAGAATRVEALGFDLEVALGGRRERFAGLSLDGRSPASAAGALSDSHLIEIEVLPGTTPLPFGMPAPCRQTRLGGGDDGLDGVGADDLIGEDLGPERRSGLCALAAVDEVATLACPDAADLARRIGGADGERAVARVQDAMVEQCERLRDRIALLDGPPARSPDQVRRWRRRFDSSFAACYWPWLAVAGGGDGRRWTPPSGAIAGLLARRDREGGPHLAPANAALTGAIDLAVSVGEDDLATLNADGINALRSHRGIRPWGARTASADPAWRYLTTRRLFVVVRRSALVAMGWVAFESNHAATWARLRERLRQFLDGLHRRGALVGATAAEAYYVRCDAEQNPPDGVAAGILSCEIGIAPTSPAEFVVVQLVQRMGAA